MQEYVTSIESVKADLQEYRGLLHPESGVEKIALWPKTFTAAELEAMRKAEEERARREEEKLAEQQRLEEEKAAASAPKKGAAKKGASKDDRTGSRGGVSSAASGVSRRKHGIEDVLKKHRLTSQDDGDRKFDFNAFERVMTEMEGATTNIGGILAAMVYQIE